MKTSEQTDEFNKFIEECKSNNQPLTYKEWYGCLKECLKSLGHKGFVPEQLDSYTEGEYPYSVASDIMFHPYRFKKLK